MLLNVVRQPATAFQPNLKRKPFAPAPVPRYTAPAPSRTTSDPSALTPWPRAPLKPLPNPLTPLPPSWLGVGISEAGGMLAADMAVVRLNASSGAWAAGDYWSTGFERPRLDVSPQLAADVRAAEGGAAGGSSSGSSSAGSGGGRAAGQDVVLLSAGHLQVGVAAGGSDTNTNTTVTNVTNVATTTTTTMTTAEFWRPLDTCDPLQDMRWARVCVCPRVQGVWGGRMSG